jgi:hypothetical protein
MKPSWGDETRRQSPGRKPEVKRPFGKPRSRWENNIRLDLMEIVWESADWIHLAEDRDQWRAVVNTVVNLRVIQKAENFSTS